MLGWLPDQLLRVGREYPGERVPHNHYGQAGVPHRFKVLWHWPFSLHKILLGLAPDFLLLFCSIGCSWLQIIRMKISFVYLHRFIKWSDQVELATLAIGQYATESRLSNMMLLFRIFLSKLLPKDLQTDLTLSLLSLYSFSL